MIRLDNVTYAYHNGHSRPALSGLSLSVERGEEIAIIGGNGCGKTTLGMLLCGILKPQAGTVSIGEQQPEASRRSVGFLFQDPDNGLVATMVDREVAFALENQNLPSERIRQIVDGTLAMFELTDYRNRLVWNLSGGEKQRLALAGLLAGGPDILFLDEPASFLDLAGTERLAASVQRVREENPDLIIIRVTQFPRVAAEYNRVVLMHDGDILADGAPAEVFADDALLRRSGVRSPLEYLTPVTPSEAPPPDADTEPAPPVVSLQGIRFGYEKDRPLFDGLSLVIGEGEVLGLIGPSGCGKSTLAQIICGIYRPDAGSITFHGTHGRAVMSFQQPERQFFHETVFDEVAFSLRRHGLEEATLERTVAASLETAGLDFERFRGRAPHTLSGGEARRLAFAIVLALNADVLIFDEPTCGLDEQGIQSFLEMVEQVRASGVAVVIITHNGDIIADACDRVALLGDGRIAATPATREFFLSGGYEGVLLTPEVIDYQLKTYGEVTSVRMRDIFPPG